MEGRDPNRVRAVSRSGRDLRRGGALGCGLGSLRRISIRLSRLALPAYPRIQSSRPETRLWGSRSVDQGDPKGGGFQPTGARIGRAWCRSGRCPSGASLARDLRGFAGSSPFRAVSERALRLLGTSGACGLFAVQGGVRASASLARDLRGLWALRRSGRCPSGRFAGSGRQGGVRAGASLAPDLRAA